MTRTELFKLRTHRTPWVLLTTLIASLSVAPVYYAIRNPIDAAAVIDTFVGIFEIIPPLLGAVFGGWIVGHEFRQGTLRRVLGSDARRGRLIATKAAVGLGAMIAGMSIAAGIGTLASVASVTSFDQTILWDGVLRDVLSSGFLAIVVAAIAFAFSILFRSDTYAMLGSLGLLLILGPLLTLIPTIGKYTPAALAGDVTSWISGPEEELGVAIVTASFGLAAFIAFLSAAAMATFNQRDI